MNKKIVFKRKKRKLIPYSIVMISTLLILMIERLLLEIKTPI